MRFLFFFLLLAGTATASNIDFISNDLTAARFKAQKSGKLIIVKFYADWCAPCKVMDEYVWTEPDLVDYVEQNCVAAKIDVDNFDGLNYKQHFSIERLPTTLILDACGNEVARYENYVSPNRMMSWIQLFDKKEHRTCPEGNSVAMPEAFLTTDKPVPGAVLDSVEVPKPPVSPEVAFVDNITKPTETAVAPGQSPDKNQKWRIFKKKKEEPAPTQSETGLAKPVADNHNLATAKPEIYPSTHPEELTPTTTGEPVLFPQPFRPAPATFAAPAAATGTGIFWEMKKPTGFAVQVMASSTADGADEMKNLCLSQFGQQPVAVISPSVSGDNLYRVMVGIFNSKTEADNFKKQVRAMHKDAFVRDLGSF